MQLNALQQWYQSSPGNWLLQFEQEQCKKWLPLMHGSTVVQIGGLPDSFNVAQHCNRSYFYLSPDLKDESDDQIDLVADYIELPFLRHSIDLMLLVHVLETAEHPSVLLKEAFDVLAPNGKLLLFCFNPWSVWGINKAFKRTSHFPWQGRFISPAKLQHWLSMIGFSHLKDKTFCFRAPFISRPLNRTSMFIEALGQIAFPMLGAVNVFLVEKRVYGSTLRRPYQWQQEKIINGTMARPTSRIKSG